MKNGISITTQAQRLTLFKTRKKYKSLESFSFQAYI